MKLVGNKNETEVFSTIVFYVLVVNHENRVNEVYIVPFLLCLFQSGL